MTYTMIAKGREIPVLWIDRKLMDKAWDYRPTIECKVEMTPAEAAALFVDDLSWSLRRNRDTGDSQTEDCSLYSMAGGITDNRDGTVTVKMGKAKTQELVDVLTGGAMTLTAARTARAAIETGAESLTDQMASTAPSLFPALKKNGSLVKAGTRINWNGQLKRAASDLWDTAENSPDSAPDLWEDVNYRAGVRVIPETITAGLAFAVDELGWWKGEVYKNILGVVNTYTPDQYPAGWEKQ